MLTSQRDQPNTQREYETIYVLRPDAGSDRIKDVNARVNKVIDDADGKLLRVENWGKRKLAYEIRKNNKGIYLYWRYLAPATLVLELERNLRMLDDVIRFLTVKVDEDVDPKARPSDVTPETLDAASETAPDEEDYYLQMSRGSEARAAADDDSESDTAGADEEYDAAGETRSDDANEGTNEEAEADSPTVEDTPSADDTAKGE